MRMAWELTQAAFESLLAALSPDRDAAAGRYLEVRRNLVRMFEWRGCPAPEEYADEALNRCARKLQEGEEIRDIASYTVGVGRMLLREMGHRKENRPLEEAPEPRTMPLEPDPESERRVECLRGCLSHLSAGNRDLILHYYQGEKGDKIRTRKSLTELFSIPANVLRMRALRLRQTLHGCVEQCLQGKRGISR